MKQTIAVPPCLLALTLAAAAPAADPAAAPPRASPPGPHVRKADPALLAKTAFRADAPIVGTYYFYWYDSDTREHFVDGDGSDALTDHPVEEKGYSYRSPDWHRRELLDILAAGIDFILPVYWGYPGDHGSWSFAGLPPLVDACRRLERQRKKPPRIGLFYDTSTLQWNGRGFHADLTTPEGKEWLYVSARDFFSMVPPDLRATIEGRPILWLYSAGFAKRQDPRALKYLREEFRKDFGVEPFIVKEVSWQGEADATYAWGAALNPSVLGVAAVGPGYDHSAVPGRAPLVKEREGGAFYRRSWEHILSFRADRRPKIVVVETWNELHEGTEIAPSREHGRLYVELTGEFAGLWKSGKVLERKGPYARAAEVAAVLGGKNEGRGLDQAESADGVTRAAKAEGKEGRETEKVPAHGGRYMYFDVDDSFYSGDLLPLEVEVTYLDRSGGPPTLEYDSADETAFLSGAFKGIQASAVKGDGPWRTAVFRLADAAFTGRSNGHDFRLAPPGAAELLVHRVAVRKVAEPKR